MKKQIKSILSVAVVVVAVFLFFWIGRATYLWYQSYRWFKQTDVFMAAGERPFSEDTYGGKTPEETWAMYVDAVKKLDIDLASKYVDVNHQKKEKEFLTDEKKIDNLDLYIYQISNPLKKRTEPEYLVPEEGRAYYFYKFKSSKQPGKIIMHDVNFYLNPLTNIWKILY